MPSAALSWHENEYHIVCYLQSGMYETVLRIVVSSSLRSIVPPRSNSVRIRYNESVRERRCDAAKLGGGGRGFSDDAFIDF